jgi:hypothetical protein
VPYRPAHGDVFELRAVARAAKEQSAATHVAAPDKVDREKQSIAKDFHQQIGILSSRDAAEEHDVFRAAQFSVEPLCRRPKRSPIAFIATREIDLGEASEIGPNDSSFWRDQPLVRRDHQRRGTTSPPTERMRIRELAAEVESTQERKYVPDRRSF